MLRARAGLVTLGSANIAKQRPSIDVGSPLASSREPSPLARIDRFAPLTLAPACYIFTIFTPRNGHLAVAAKEDKIKCWPDGWMAQFGQTCSR